MKLSVCTLGLALAFGLVAQAQTRNVSWGADRLAAALPLDSALAPIHDAGAFRLSLPKTNLRPGERYLEAIVELSPSEQLAGLEWDVRVLKPGQTAPVSLSRRPITQQRACFDFDARAVGSTEGILQVSLLRGGKSIAVAAESFSVAQETPFDQYPAPAVMIDWPKSHPDEKAAWVTFGVPMPRGAVWTSDRFILTDEKGATIPSEFKPSAQWARGGSQKWLLVDALVPNQSRLQVKIGESSVRLPKIQVRQSHGLIEVDTGAARYSLVPRGGIIDRIDAGGTAVAGGGNASRGLFVIDQQGRLGRVAGKDTTLTVESSGSLTACIKAEGIYRSEDGSELARFSTWLQFAVSRPECRITHHLVLTQDTNKVWFKQIGWEFPTGDWKASQGIFSISRDEPGKIAERSITDGEAMMIQTEHRRYGGGADRFEITEPNSPAKAFPGEMGDWAAAFGSRGLLIACRESARQHPSAFRISPHQVAVDLFCSTGGEELDFRSPALVKKWNTGNRIAAQTAENTSRLPTNAVGWSKTHYLLISPFPQNTLPATLAAAGASFATPVYAAPDPQWVYRTEVAGPLYPQDRKQFPEVESFIDGSFDYWASGQEAAGEYGFVDFHAGPHHTRELPQSQGRYRASYTLRNAFWLLYLRSGERKFRDLASWSNRVYLDSYLANWDGPDRISGLYIHGFGTNDPYAGLPYYWNGPTRPGLGTHTNLDQFLFDYYLTGNPRTREGVLAYAEGVKRWWKNEKTDWRILAVLRAVNQAYSLTWDQELRTMQEEILNSVYSDQSPVFLKSEGRAYDSSTYKTQEDLSALIEGWDLHGTKRYWNIATSLARFWWQAINPGPRFERGRSGNFLWKNSRDETIAQRLLLAVRQEIVSPFESNSASAEFRFQGIPYALDVIARSKTNAIDSASFTSWVGFEPLSGRSGVILRKQAQGFNASLQFEHAGLKELPEVIALNDVSKIGLSTLSMNVESGNGIRLSAPPELDPVDLFVSAPPTGLQQAFLNQKGGFVLYADGWWKPNPEKLNPPVKIFFEVPKDATGATISFERKTRVYAPDGAPWNGGKPVQGPLSLPPDLPGLWHFVPVESGAVKATNIPPLFAFDRPDSYFRPDLGKIPAAKSSLPSLELKGTVVGPGHPLLITSDPKTLPREEGTIEFYLKPAWDSFELQDGTRKRLLMLRTDHGKPWSLLYVVDSKRAGWPGNPWSKSHVLEMTIEAAGASQRDAYRIRRTLFNKGEWVHVALVWGQRNFGYTKNREKPSLDAAIFINGVGGKSVSWPRQGSQPAAAPIEFLAGADLDGEIAHLRISGCQRYKEDFTPPSVEMLTRNDEKTLLFLPLEKKDP